ncbi:MAG: transposase [Actinomycetota bacterium]|jgi:transposase|nr:transposase [Actinomycetota bacterium]
MVYVGIDVHRKRSQVAVLDEAGVQLSNRNYENTSEDFRAALEELEPGTQVAFEAAYGWGWLADMLEECELEAHLTHPSACKAIANARLKNDKVDARILAQLLRTDFLPEAWIAPKEVRDLRSLLRHRASLVKVRTSLKNRIHAMLADEGLKAEGQKLWTEEGQAWLAGVELRPVHREIVDDCCGLLDALAIPIARVEAEIRAAAKPDLRVEALTSIYGVGLITSMTLVAEIGDISRFATARKLCAWAGLTPSVHNSDRKVRHGHITKAGPAAVRAVLTEASYQARHVPPFAQFFEDTAKRRGKPIATVALSRKILARCFHILKELETPAA